MLSPHRLSGRQVLVGMAVCNCELIQPESCVSNTVLRRGCVCLCWSLGPVRTRGHHSLGLEVFRPPRGVRAGTRHPWTPACSVSTPKAAVPHRSRGSRSESAPPQGRVLPLLYAWSPGNVALRGPSLPPCPSARPFILVFPCFPYFISGSSMFRLVLCFYTLPSIFRYSMEGVSLHTSLYTGNGRVECGVSIC